MQRRLFLLSAPAAALATALASCGGGGGGVAGPVPDTQQPAPAGEAAPAKALGYPFGARRDPYVAGIRPGAVTQAQMDGTVRACYDAWKAENLVRFDEVVPGGMAVRFRDHPEYRTVSEGMGYGMLLTVLMAGHDPQARTCFDGLLKVVRARPAYSTGRAALHESRLGRDGTSAGEGWNALDGDLDIAMALLMADRQWGSYGQWHYKDEALATIAAIRAFNMKADGTTKGLPSPHDTRTSDFMVGHFRAFRRATGDAFWDRAVERAWALIDHMQRVYSPLCGLMPDFIINTNTDNPEPSRGFIGDGVATEGYYFANACRNPWRFGTDFVTSGDAQWQRVCEKLVSFIEFDCGGDPQRIAYGYQLDGTPLDRSGAATIMAGPMLCGAMVAPRFQGFLDRLWTWNEAHFTTEYYDSELQLMPMIVASGNWWNP